MSLHHDFFCFFFFFQAEDGIRDADVTGVQTWALPIYLDDAGWATPTPAAGWTVAHQIAHLAWTDQSALLAATDADGFAAHLREAAKNPQGFVDEAAQQDATRPPEELLVWWRQGREQLA